jgi:hypothetical protein
VTWQAQGENLEQKLKELHDKVPGQSAPQRAFDAVARAVPLRLTPKGTGGDLAAARTAAP